MKITDRFKAVEFYNIFLQNPIFAFKLKNLISPSMPVQSN
jgi:hypothetical protein